MTTSTPATPLSTPGPAPARARVLAQARFELATLLANGEQLLVSLVLPLGALVGLAVTTVPSLAAPGGAPVQVMPGPEQYTVPAQ